MKKESQTAKLARLLHEVPWLLPYPLTDAKTPLPKLVALRHEALQRSAAHLVRRGVRVSR